jgi:hypothetical protein
MNSGGCEIVIKTDLYNSDPRAMYKLRDTAIIRRTAIR